MATDLFETPNQKRIDYAKRHARSYLTPAGNRLNLSAIVLKFNIAPWCFTGWQERGWPALKGKSLESVPMPLGYYGRTEPTFLESKVEAALPCYPINGWSNAYTWSDKEGSTYLTIFGIRKLYPAVSRKSVERWGDKKKGVKCRFLLDKQGKRRFIQSKRVRPPIPRAVGKVRVYLETDIQEIVKRMGEGILSKTIETDHGPRWDREAVHTDGDGRRWLTDMQLMQTHEVGRGFLLWAYKESKLRSCPPGHPFDSKNPADRTEYAALRSKKIPNQVKQKGSPGEINVYLEDDHLTIRDGKEGKILGVGKGANADRLRDELLEKAKNVVATLPGLRNGHELRTGRIIKLVEEKARVGETIARRAVKKMTVERKEGQNKRFRRLRQRFASNPASGNGQAPESVPTNGKDTPTVPAPSRVLPSEEPFVPTAFQKRIWDALNGRSLTADELQEILSVGRKQLYRDGLKELMAKGKVDNNRRVGGYFRPDALAEKYGEFFKKEGN